MSLYKREILNLELISVKEREILLGIMINGKAVLPLDEDVIIKGKCKCCGDMTIAEIGYYEKIINTKNSGDIKYKWVYTCRECSNFHSRIEVIIV